MNPATGVMSDNFAEQVRQTIRNLQFILQGVGAGIAGAGLGLPLALHVVEAHRGRIAVVSDPGRGSTFSVRIPLPAQA